MVFKGEHVLTGMTRLSFSTAAVMIVVVDCGRVREIQGKMRSLTSRLRVVEIVERRADMAYTFEFRVGLGRLGENMVCPWIYLPR